MRKVTLILLSVFGLYLSYSCKNPSSVPPNTDEMHKHEEYEEPEMKIENDSTIVEIIEV